MLRTPMTLNGVGSSASRRSMSTPASGESGKRSTSCSVTSCRRWSSLRRRPKIVPRKTKSGTIAKRTWYEIAAAICGLR